VKNRFQNVPFTFNLYRYTAVAGAFPERAARHRGGVGYSRGAQDGKPHAGAGQRASRAVLQGGGQYKSNSVDLTHSLKAPGFNSNLEDLSSDKLVSNLCAFKCSLFHYCAALMELIEFTKEEAGYGEQVTEIV
jgi:hypothetical protein